MTAKGEAYAAETRVSVERSAQELEGLLARHGATEFAYGWAGTDRQVGFRIGERSIRMRVRMPRPEDTAVLYTPVRHVARGPAEQKRALEQVGRQRWRALILVVRAKLEAIETGITTMEEEFLSGVIVPDGRTVGEWLVPQLAEIGRTRELPLLPAGRA